MEETVEQSSGAGGKQEADRIQIQVWISQQGHLIAVSGILMRDELLLVAGHPPEPWWGRGGGAESEWAEITPSYIDMYVVE